ncbi:pesticin C-terminus-like muramidase [Kaarinaea lacus]
MSNSIDFSFISSLEGGQQLRAYVPASGVSNSGVTVATGFDLGARNEADLKKLNLSTSLQKKLKPFLGLKKAAAVNALKTTNLIISKNEADSIDKAVKKEATDLLVRRYNAAIKPAQKQFSQLPKEAQTVIASVAYQYGNLSTRAPKFWKAVTDQNWADTVKQLKNFGDRYTTRRNKEAALLQSIVKTATAKP